MKYKQWNQAASDPAAVAALERAGLPTLAAMTLCARGMDTPEKARAFLDAGRGQLQDPLLMKDMDRAAARVARALAAVDAGTPGTVELSPCIDVEETIALAKEKGAHAVLVLENGSERRVEL